MEQRTTAAKVHTHPFSQGKVISVNTATWTAKNVHAFQPPDGLLVKSQCSTQLLPNGNALVNLGSEGAMTEFRPDGTPIFPSFHGFGSREFSGEATCTGFETFLKLASHPYQRSVAEAVSARVVHIQNAVLSYGSVLAGFEGRGSWTQLILQA
ncbi:hypothetical protein PENNAL_c0009G09706 [Penicillium nalgiovense]|uniref:Uncharacterized protein n=1 Tax=Penicillium nalgiovense TaxID=60175 RepID=A0A1V6YVU5_PENNA|nr:hypothetical protein PENNAL_c0009G09706 [Penicillium nalgiovense]